MQPLSRLLDSGFLFLLKREPLEKEPLEKERSPLRQNRYLLYPPTSLCVATLFSSE